MNYGTLLVDIANKLRVLSLAASAVKPNPMKQDSFVIGLVAVRLLTVLHFGHN